MPSKIIEYGINSLNIEISALNAVLTNSINKTFEKVVNTILNTKGRVILSAVGKPGYIAHRVAATLASTGTPSYYIHPTEASHGDLGMISRNDTVILLSNSGQSKELNDIIAYCKRFDITLIGITRSEKSFLAETATIPVILDNIKQTNAVDSPTTSEIMVLSYLDAVATALINIKHFNKNDFKIFHPGGKIGSSLIKVEEIMHTGAELPLGYEHNSMEDIIKIMIDKPLGCVGILNEQNSLVGIITDGDLKRKIIQYNDLKSKKIVDIMTKDPITITANIFALDAVKIMQHGVGPNNNYIQVLFVIEEYEQTKKVVGLIHIQDCLKNGII